MEAAKWVLAEAEVLISSDRYEDYGHPAVNFNRIAGMWDAFLSEKLQKDHPEEHVVIQNLQGEAVRTVSAGGGGRQHITASDVAALMAMVKLSRIAQDPEKMDSWADLAGYAALGAEVST